MTDTEAVFEQLKHEIDQARRTGMSMQAVARQAGLCNSTLHLWLNGKAKAPRLRTMIRVAEALGKPIERIDGMPRIAPGEVWPSG
jgi:transcriptional regulator with XRE-family HTH domain